MGAPGVSAGREDGSVQPLFADLYHELHRLAHARLKRGEPLTLLDTTSLVHETWLRFAKAGHLDFADRAQLLAYAAHVMRSIIVDSVRRRHAGRHGGGQAEVTLDTAVVESASAGEEEILRVNEALDELAKVDARLVKIVELRYFAGLGEEEIAASLGVTDRTVRRYWEKARLLLSLALR